jgi:glycosyltransferase involved in cell wall biosynthesis
VERVFSGAAVTPLRVCIDARLRSGQFGGVEQVVIGLASGLSAFEDGDEEYLFLVNPGEDAWIRPHLGGPCRLLPTRRSRPNRRARAIGRALAERAPGIGTRFSVRVSDRTVERAGADLVHFPIQDAFRTDLPSIYQPHDLQHLHLPELFSGWQRARRERIYRNHCERAEAVVTMTSWGRRDVIESYGLDESKVWVVPGASVLTVYPAPTADELEGMRSRFGLSDSFLLYPAQPWPHKNHERLLEALAFVRERTGETIPLVCTGAAARAFEGVRAHAAELGLGESISFPGFVSPKELRGLYELATALVFPSRFEGWGLPVCEAFTAGLPVASSNATGLPDLVGDAGLIFDPLEVEEIAEAVQRIWESEDLRRELAERGRERGALFSWDRTARLFRAHYRRVGGRRLAEEDRILLAAPPPA